MKQTDVSCGDNGKLSGRQIFCLLVLFVSGSIGTVGGGGGGRDIWLLLTGAKPAMRPMKSRA